MFKHAAALAILLAIPSLVYAKSGVQLCPGGQQTLVSKDVGDERWAIMYDMKAHTVMGNVFFASGGPPAFVYCQEVETHESADPRHAMMTFTCFGARACAADPCDPDDWQPLGEVTLPGDFFMPPTGGGMMR